MNIIIPIGGKGERFLKEGYKETKPLITILDKYMIYYVLDNLKVNLNDKVYIIYDQRLNEYNFSKLILDRYENMDISLIQVVNTKGAVETIKTGLEFIMKSSTLKKCFIMDCDTFYTEDVLNMYRNIDINVVFYVLNKEEKPIYSYIVMDEEDKIVNIKEKIKISDNANVGIYCFNDIDKLYTYCIKLMERYDGSNIELYTSLMIETMIQNNEVFKGIQLDQKYVFNIGTPLQVKNYIKRTSIFLFDLDGTLVLTDQIYKEVWKYILKQHNISLNDDLYEKCIYGKTDKFVVNALLNSDDDFFIQNISTQKDELFIQRISDIKVVEGTREFIKKILMNGHKVSIVTNCNRKVAECILQYTSLFYDYLVIGNECSKPKPSPDPYLKAMTNYNTKNNIIVFEDSLSGINSALGIYPKCLVGLKTQYDSDTLKAYGVNLVIENFMDNNEMDLLQKLEEIDNSVILSIKKMIMNSLTVFEIANMESIEIDNVKAKCGFICDIINVCIKMSDKKYFCVLKIDNKKQTLLSSVANDLDLYEREYYFYENISKYVNIKVPKFYGLIKDDSKQNVGILLENLYKENCINNVELDNESIDISLNIIKYLSSFHSKFWNKINSNMFPKLKRNNDALFQPSWKNFIDKRINIFKEKWKHILSNEHLELVDTLNKNFNHIQNRLSIGHLTLCHGDVKSPNMFFTSNMDPIFIDWQYISIGKGVQDLVFFMIESFSTFKIKKYFSIFKDYYYIKLLENGIEYTVKEYNKDFLDSIFYFPFFVVIWFGTVDDDELIDKNFPYFFITKFFNFVDIAEKELNAFNY